MNILNMLTMKKIATVCFCVLMTMPLWAQIDEDRMQRDLEISKSILATLLNEDGKDFARHTLVSGRSIEANYVEGFGVIFKIPQHGMLFSFHDWSPKIGMNAGNISQSGKGRAAVVIRSEDGDNKSTEITVETDEEIEIEEEEVEEMEEMLEDIVEENKSKDKNKVKDKDKREKSVVKSYSYSIKSSSDEQDEDWKVDNEKLEEKIIAFLADYADLISQLKPDDKILVKKDASNENVAFIWTDEDGERTKEEYGTGMSVRVLKKDINDYKSGKIDRDDFVSRLEIVREKKKEKIADLEIFGNIFKQYFSPQYSKTFFTNSTPDYERLEGMGAIFQTRTYSSYKENEFYYLPAMGDDKVDEKERKEKIESLYPKFIEDVKLFIVDYGRTIKSLNDDEKLIMKIEMTKCDACSVPKFVEATVPVSALKNYDQQKITREKALAAIDIKEIK